ncbi:MAG: TolB family protein [Acidobacteriia bacterium]|nr:TolB family protein [Terriglobia bacterium]
MSRHIWMAAAAAGAFWLLAAQDKFDLGTITKEGERPRLAIPDFRGSGQAQSFMAPFNQTLWNDVDSGGVLRMVPKTMYPTTVPQQPTDFRQAPPPAAQAQRGRRGEMVQAPTGGGLWMSDWSGPPAQANYLAIGYTAVQNNLFVLRGWLLDLGRGTQVIAKTYIESLDEAGARKAAHEFAAEILAQFGGKSLFGTHIYFVRQQGRTGPKEVWVMDPDGKNQRPLTHFNSISNWPAVSPDGTKIAFTSWAHIYPGIFVFSVDPVRDLRFYNQRGVSTNSTPSFTPDGKQIVFSSSAGGCCRIFLANLDGSNLRPISSSSSIDVEPKVNPKTGAEIVFVSGRSGPQQIYKMNMDGADVERLSDGTGEASNPSWHPDGQILAFAWTRGYATGAFNIFVMDVASRQYTQLSHEGRNENPSWAPDGRHLAFMSTRAGGHQIWTMLANGTQLQQLTTQGNNDSPAWGR